MRDKKKNMEPLVSVVIPVFNSGKEIISSVRSVLNQTYKSYEVIIVNDGSTDDTGIYLDKIKEIEKKITIIEQENQGVSVARNVGISVARGKYISFLDSGDLYDKDFLDRMIFYAESGMFDIVSCGYNCGKKNITWEEDVALYGQAFHEKIWDMYSERPFFPCWNKLFLLSIILENNIKFPVGQAMGEDLNFVLQYMLYANSCKLVKDTLYEYVIDVNSVTHSKYKPEWVSTARNTVLIWIKYSEFFNYDRAKINERIITEQILACMKVASANNIASTKNVCIEVLTNKDIKNALNPLKGNFFIKYIVRKLIEQENILMFLVICLCGGMMRKLKRLVRNAVFIGEL